MTHGTGQEKGRDGRGMQDVRKQLVPECPACGGSGSTAWSLADMGPGLQQRAGGLCTAQHKPVTPTDLDV